MSSETSPVRREREAQGLRLIDLAERADMSPGHISMIETRGYIPSLRSKEKLAKGLGMSVEELWPEVEG